LKHYLQNKKQTRKDILKNYLSTSNPKQQYKNKQEIENAIRNINDEMEEAQNEFSKLFITNEYEKR
jgi:TorA maturation chaperone TorD